MIGVVFNEVLVPISLSALGDDGMSEISKMSDAFESDGAKNVLESIARRVPGFAGYLDKEERRESDTKARRWLADRLDASKPNLDAYTRALTEQGQLDGLAACDKLRNKIELLISRLRGAPAGYSGFFDTNKIDEDRLDDVLDHDLWLMEQADKAAAALEALASDNADIATADSEVQLLDSRFGERTKLLAGDEVG